MRVVWSYLAWRRVGRCLVLVLALVDQGTVIREWGRRKGCGEEGLLGAKGESEGEG